MQSRAGDAWEGQVAAVVMEFGLDRPQVTTLAGGLLNRTLRLKDAHQDLVLHLAGAGAELLGADRHAELAMLQLAAGAGLAPRVVLSRPAEGLLVTHHVAGRVLTREDAREHGMLIRIGAWLARLHALEPPVGLAAIDIATRAAGYLQVLHARNSTTLLRDLGLRLSRLREKLPPPRRLAACHHDLHHFNLVDTGAGLVALDWEYSGPGDPAADLAACICYQDLDRRQTKILLASYGDASEELAARLELLVWVFDCLCYGWMEVVTTQGLAADPERRRRLLDRLMG